MVPSGPPSRGRRGSRAARAGAPDADRYLAELADPAALTAGLNWYRANLPVVSLPGTDTPSLPPVGCETLGIFGADDPYLSERAMVASEAYVASGRWRWCAPAGARAMPTRWRWPPDS